MLLLFIYVSIHSIIQSTNFIYLFNLNYMYLS